MKFQVTVIVVSMVLLFGGMAGSTKSQDAIKPAKDSSAQSATVGPKNVNQVIEAKDLLFERNLLRMDSIVNATKRSNEQLKAENVSLRKSLYRLEGVVRLIPEKVLKDYSIESVPPMSVAPDTCNKIESPALVTPPKPKRRTLLQKINPFD